MKPDKALYVSLMEVFTAICIELAVIWLVGISQAETVSSLTNRTTLFIMAVYIAVMFKRHLKHHNEYQ
jgi:hypothetical protein